MLLCVARETAGQRELVYRKRFFNLSIPGSQGQVAVSPVFTVFTGFGFIF